MGIQATKIFCEKISTAMHLRVVCLQDSTTSKLTLAKRKSYDSSGVEMKNVFNGS